MKILIAENEIYLAQSIATKLTDLGYSCEVATTIKEALKDEKFDVVLLSTNINGQNFYPVLQKHKDSITILLVSYITHDTTSNPLRAGAKDYVLKPFMMEELIRKIKHFIEFEKIKQENRAFKEYLNFSFREIEIDIGFKPKLPLLIITNYQKYADYFAFEFAQKIKMPFKFFSLSSSSSITSKIQTEDENNLLYITDFQSLKRSEKKNFFSAIENKMAIISSTENITETIPINHIELKSNNKVFDRNEILSINDYIKYIILNYQNRYPDTTLAKKLGISRKSLWEKRKKYEIFKKK